MSGMSDCRYKKTEEKLLSVFFDARFETMREIAKRAGVARSTIYTHHHKIMEIIPDWEEYILKEYGLFLEKGSYFEMLVFILKHQKYFEVFLKFGDREIIIKMIFKMWRVENSEKIYKILASEISEIIFEWGEKGFSKKEIENVLANINYLSNTVRDRLGLLYK